MSFLGGIFKQFRQPTIEDTYERDYGLDGRTKEQYLSDAQTIAKLLKLPDATLSFSSRFTPSFEYSHTFNMPTQKVSKLFKSFVGYYTDVTSVSISAYKWSKALYNSRSDFYFHSFEKPVFLDVVMVFRNQSSLCENHAIAASKYYDAAATFVEKTFNSQKKVNKKSSSTR